MLHRKYGFVGWKRMEENWKECWYSCVLYFKPTIIKNVYFDSTHSFFFGVKKKIIWKKKGRKDVAYKEERRKANIVSFPHSTLMKKGREKGHKKGSREVVHKSRIWWDIREMHWGWAICKKMQENKTTGRWKQTKQKLKKKER
jgi:hypothetical protein